MKFKIHMGLAAGSLAGAIWLGTVVAQPGEQSLAAIGLGALCWSTIWQTISAMYASAAKEIQAEIDKRARR